MVVPTDQETAQSSTLKEYTVADPVSYPLVDFPYIFYKFISTLAKSHPHIVAWSECGSYFQIDRHAKELSPLIGRYFQHNVYQSLRRQMNMYGFHLLDKVDKPSRHTNWWCRSGGYFCRDNPQLHKIRPRRRPERIKNIFTSEEELKQYELLADEEEEPKIIKTLKKAKSLPPVTKVKTEKKKKQKSNDVPNATLFVDRSVGKNVSTDSTKKDNTAHSVVVDFSDDNSYKKLSPTISQQFPALLHQFISDCSVSFPDIVQWNPDHTAFNVEIHHPGLPALLMKYFQHGNYSSLRRQLNFYGFRRDIEGFYRNEHFSEGNYHKIVSRASRDRLKRLKTTVDDKRPRDNKTEDSSDNDDLSSVFDHDLSTYNTLKNDEMSFERMENQDVEEVNNQEYDLSSSTKPTSLPKFKTLEKVYVRDKDGVMYVSVIRRQLYGPRYLKQVDMGLVESIDEAQEKLNDDDHECMWHYFVHFDHWNVNFDRWVSECDVFAISDKIVAIAKKISKEHRELQLEMRKTGLKGKKGYQTIDGAAFLREWKRRLQRIHEEMDFDLSKDTSAYIFDENAQQERFKSDHSTTRSKKTLSWTKSALANEQKYRMQGLTSRSVANVSNGITLPFALKKIVVQQWEYINQCQMMPCIPAPISIRHALNKYLESKNVSLSPTEPSKMNSVVGTGSRNEALDHASGTEHGQAKVDDDDIASDRLEIDRRGQEWRDMADGIAMLFDESLESRLLYREELPQLQAIFNFPEYHATPYSELYGCEHLLRLFIRLPELLADNLPDDESRPIIAKVNDFIRFLNKNHSTLLSQTHRKLNELEKREQQKLDNQEEKKRKDQPHNDELRNTVTKKSRQKVGS